MSLHPLDVAVVAVYFGLTLGLGLWVSRRGRDTEAYFLGGRNFPGWAIGLSLVGTMISSVTFLAYPADAFKTAWLRFAPNLAFPLVVAFTGWLFVPFFRRGNLTSAYQYLALRFGRPIAAYAAAVFLLAQMARTATVLYLLAVMLATITGWSVVGSILLAGVVTAAYTVKGGFTAVVWTDVVQTTILIGGGILCVVTIAAALPGGWGQIGGEAWAAHKLSFLDLNSATGKLEAVGRGFSLRNKTVTMLVLAGVLQFLTGKVDQTTVQRWCAARSLREARKSMVVLGIAGLPIWGLFMFTGSALWVYYRHHPDATAAAILAGSLKAEAILPHYILTGLPAGVAGLVVAAALSASMGSLASSINASAMVWVRDLYQPLLAPCRSDQHYLRVGLFASLSVSVAMILGAWLFYRSEAKTMNEIGFIVVQVLGGGICGTFLLGMFTRWGDARSVGCGLAAAVATTLYVILGEFGLVPRLFDSYYTSIVANGVMLVTALGVGAIGRLPRRELTHLTVWD
jgi:SSS family solute:Na+ symporter